MSGGSSVWCKGTSLGGGRTARVARHEPPARSQSVLVSRCNLVRRRSCARNSVRRMERAVVPSAASRGGRVPGRTGRRRRYQCSPARIAVPCPACTIASPAPSARAAMYSKRFALKG